MHLAFVIENLNLLHGGAQRMVLSLAGGLADSGHTVDLVLFDPIIRNPVPDGVRLFAIRDTPDEITAEQFGRTLAGVARLSVTSGVSDWMRAAAAFHWDPFYLPSRRRVHMARGIAYYAASERPDCILPSLHRSIVSTLLARRLSGDHPPLIPIIHSSLEAGQNFRTRGRYRRLFADATHFVGVSQDVSRGLAEVIKVPDERITTIYNPVVTPNLHARAAETPDHPWLRDDGTPVVLAAGSLVRQKDHPTLIRAFARLTARRPCRLIILGEGSKRTETEGLLEELKLTDRVSLPGWVENPLAFMARASLFVLSSRWEGLPTVLVDALACGCPCVSTDCPSGPAEILLNGEIGPLVPVGDDAALAKAMERVLDRPPDRQALQRRAADFSADRAVAAYEKLLWDLVR